MQINPDDWLDVSLPDWDSVLEDLAGFAELQFFQEFEIPWADFVANSADISTIGNITHVTGDFHDLQLGIDADSFGFLQQPFDESAISIGNILHSTASQYDMVVIEQDLVEINIIVQYSLGDFQSTASQTNMAAIFDYSASGSFHLTAGQSLNVASIQQMNLAIEAAGSMQINEASIFQDVSDGSEIVPEFMSGYMTDGFGMLPNSWMSNINADPDFSMLYVSGTFYEVNVIFQFLDEAAVSGADDYVNAAIINDFDGVARFQLVGGDEYDLSSIAQLNFLSDSDGMMPDELEAIFNSASSIIEPLFPAAGENGVPNPVPGISPNTADVWEELNTA